MMCFAHAFGIVIGLMYLICGIMAIATGGAWDHVVMFLVDIVLGILVFILEAPEVLPFGCFNSLKSCLSFMESALAHFIFYLVLCFTFIGSGVGYSWIVSVLVVFQMLIYAYCAFCGGGSSSSSSSSAKV